MSTALRWIGFLGIATIAVMRLVIVFAPELHFDVDPAFDPHPMAGLGPAASLLLDVLLLLGCAAALTGEWLSRRGIEWKLIALALLPAPILLWHGTTDLFDLWRGMTWQAGFIAAVTIAHLARDRSMRVIVVAVLIAAVAPLIVRGLSQVTVEHAQTIATFEQHREQFLRDRGWEPDSSNALIYERRLRQPQPLGWFTTTNIFASTLLPLLALGAGLAMALRRSALPSGWIGLLVLIAAVCIGGVWLSGSKGAMLIALVAIMLAVIPSLTARPTLASSPPSPLVRLAPALLLGLPFLALAGVFVRGWLPETFLGDRSLLFRWHYLVSSAGIFAESPLLGVGPDGYQEAYIRHRLPRNPEEVASSHSMFIDWLCTLGVAAVAWCGLVFTLLLRAAGRLFGVVEYLDGLDMEGIMRRLARVVAALLLVAFIPAIMTELHVLDAYGMAVRIVGAVAFAALALAVAYVTLTIDAPLVNWSLAIGAAALVMHGQIEMTFFQPGFVVWGLCVLGVAGGAATSTQAAHEGHHSRWLLVWPGIIVLLVVWVTFSAALPAMQQARDVRAAAHMLYPLADQPLAAIEQRRKAGRTLLDAHALLPTNRLLLHHAVGQLERAATAPNTPSKQRVPLLLKAMQLADRAIEKHSSTSCYAMRSRLSLMLSMIAEDEQIKHAASQRAIDDARVLAARDPHGISGWKRLGDALWHAGRDDEAADAYRRALEADANFELDPLKQLSADQRERLIERTRRTGNESSWRDGPDFIPEGGVLPDRQENPG